MDRQSAIEHMEAYFQNFLERPHDECGGLPICPFLRQARERGAIRWRVATFPGVLELLDEVHAFCLQRHDEALLCVFTSPLTAPQLHAAASQLEAMVSLRLHVTEFHPDDATRLGELYLRRTPYPCLLLLDHDRLAAARKELEATEYYRRRRDASGEPAD